MMNLKEQAKMSQLEEKLYQLDLKVNTFNKRVDNLVLQLESDSVKGLSEKRLHEITLIKQLEQELSEHGC